MTSTSRRGQRGTSATQSWRGPVVTQGPVSPPDTDLARQARDLVHENCEPHIVAHSERSFQFAALVARAEGVAVDLEVLYIGTLLHDVGLAQRFAGSERFEMRGANAVRAMLLDAGAEQLPADAVRAVLDAWPRHEFPSAFSQTLIDEVRANPSSVRSSWMECIAVAHVPGFEQADFLSTLHSSAHFA